MATRAERTALIFVSAVVLVGAGVRVARAVRHSGQPEPAAAKALATQRRAVDSVARAAKSSRGDAPAKTAKGARRSGARSGAPSPRTRRDTSANAARDAILRAPIDVDRASAAELEGLPRVGAALAARIVAARDIGGPFGSLDSLRARVKGIGPAMAKVLEPLVVFSGR